MFSAGVVCASPWVASPVSVADPCSSTGGASGTPSLSSGSGAWSSPSSLATSPGFAMSSSTVEEASSVSINSSLLTSI